MPTGREPSIDLTNFQEEEEERWQWICGRPLLSFGVSRVEHFLKASQSQVPFTSYPAAGLEGTPLFAYHWHSIWYDAKDGKSPPILGPKITVPNALLP